MADIDLNTCSKEWYSNVICTALQYELLHSWQLDITIVICKGGDAICIIATGAGKSVLIQGPAAAHIAAGIPFVGLAIVPTKGLADDQARAASSKDLPSLALHEDSLRAARSEGRDLFAEIVAGQWSLVFLGPKMLSSSSLDKMLKNSDFVDKLRAVTIDECHLSDEWKDFRTAYQNIKRFRDRLPSRVSWLAVSGTIAPHEFDAISTGLGFMPRKFALVRQPLDRPTIKYVPQFLEYPVSGTEMLDIAWIIPYNMHSVHDIPITIVFANTIGFGKRIRTYLTSLLPAQFTGRARKYLVRGYHGMNTADFRTASIEALRSGEETRIMVCTDTGAFGIDVEEVTRVVIMEPSKTFKTQAQRSGRVRKKGTLYSYSPPSMNIHDQTKKARDARGRHEPVLINFANSSLERCPRAVACEHWGEDFHQPPDCCLFHEPGPERWRDAEIKRRIDDGNRAAARKAPGLGGPRANKQSHKQLDKRDMVPAVRRLLEEWRLLTWSSVPNRSPQDPAEYFLSDGLVDHLCTRMHVCVTFELFEELMHTWEHLNEWGDKLYIIVEAILGSAQKVRAQMEVKDETGTCIKIEEDEVVLQVKAEGIELEDAKPDQIKAISSSRAKQRKM